jgi:hypothetical protein
MRITYLVMTAALAGPISPAVAQVDSQALPDEEPEELVEPIRHYSVELIIFTYREGSSASSEIWLADEPATEETVDRAGDNDFGRFDDDLTEIETHVARHYMDLELVPFGKDEFTMTRIYDMLVKLDAYEPLIRTGWTQPTYEKEVTAAIPLRTLADVPPWLDGSLTLYLGRYLHLVVDLTMNADRSVSGQVPHDAPVEPRFADSRTQNRFERIDASGELLPPPIHYRISEDRIMKNGDIRYFDHPKFGVIAKVTRLMEQEEAAPIDDTDDLLPGS